MNSGTLDSTDCILVADYLTIAVGILGVVSVVIVGYQYLTAPNHSPKIRDSKRHLGEIIFGLIIYAVIYAIFRWLFLIFSN